jgi:hypothetical protein
MPTAADDRPQHLDAGGRLLLCPVRFGARKLNEDDLRGGAQLGGRDATVAVDR